MGEFLVALGIILTAVFTWIGRKIVKLIEKNTSLKASEHMLKQVDVIAAWAAAATEQAFRKYVLSPNQTVDDKNKEKLQAAIETARRHLPPDVSSKITDEQLQDVIEAKVGQMRMSTPVVGVTLPPLSLSPSQTPSPVPSQTPSQGPSLQPTTLYDLDRVHEEPLPLPAKVPILPARPKNLPPRK
jgi:3-oxoacyl-(acyl-carrier-protein) synthase